MPVDQFSQHPLLPLGILLIAGYLVGRAANHIHLPRVSGYIVAGILLSPSFTAILDRAQIESLQGIVSTLALAVIAFAIGGSIEMSKVRMLGKPILWISLTQVVGAFIFTSLILYATGSYFPVLQAHGPEVFLSAVLIIGAVSTATAPAAVLAVVNELRASGSLTTTLLGVVALDDALTIILLSAALTIAGILQQLTVADGALLHGLLEIAGALAGGAASGLVLPYLISPKQSPEVSLVVTLGMVLMLGGLAIQAGFSPLLANMTLGFVFVNRMEHARTLFGQMENIEELLYCLFFTLAGAHFDISVLNSAAVLALALILGRLVGKISGTMLGARLSKAPAVIGKYLGITLLPQAGLSLGLVILARPYLPAEIYAIFFNAMLASVIINELIAPPLVKWALYRADEVGSGEK